MPIESIRPSRRPNSSCWSLTAMSVSRHRKREKFLPQPLVKLILHDLIPPVIVGAGGHDGGGQQPGITEQMLRERSVGIQQAHEVQFGANCLPGTAAIQHQPQMIGLGLNRSYDFLAREGVEVVVAERVVEQLRKRLKDLQLAVGFCGIAAVSLK